VIAALEGEIWLDNHVGGLNDLGSREYAAVKRGSMVELRRGHMTSEREEYAN
jgi:hypothetical protein